MSAVERRFEFLIDDEVDRDIEDVVDADPDAAALIVAIIQEMQGDRTLCERLIEPDYEDDQISSVLPFEALQRKWYNAYRVKLYEVADWRLITAVDHKQRLIALLYIMRRDENYDDKVQQSVIEAYERLGLSRMGNR